MGNNQILLDIHQVVDADGSELGELLAAFLQEGGDIISFLALCERRQQYMYMYLRDELRRTRDTESDTHHYALSMTASVPVRVGDLYLFFLHILLLPEPLLSKFFPLLALELFALAVGEE